jgi:glycosyltransferase involved in cell wall biosynthesis
MRVLVDLLYFTGAKGGMESYVRHLYERMPRDDVEYIGFASHELAVSDHSWFPGRIVDSGISGENRMAWAWGELTAVSRAARRLEADVIHSPANIGPWRSPVPVVLTVHDLLPFRHPEFVPGRYSLVLRTLIRLAVRNASHVLTVSEQSKRDLVAVLHTPADEITVSPLAGSREVDAGTVDPLSPPDAVAPPREDRTLLALGNRLPHKNFDGLLRALALIPDAERPSLVVTGSQGSDPLAATVSDLRLERWVELLGWVPTEQIEELYARASAVVVPSLFEGFGLPVLEGMSRGCPVICSDLPVLREVAGDAAAYFDPKDARSIASTVRQVLSDPELRGRLSRSGRERAASFSWQRTADSTSAAFQRALADAR